MAFKLGLFRVIARHLLVFWGGKRATKFGLGNHRSIHTELREPCPLLQSFSTLWSVQDIARGFRNPTGSMASNTVAPCNKDDTRSLSRP
jgi:hypothetical protein